MSKVNFAVLLFTCSFLCGCLAYRISGFTETSIGADLLHNSGPKYRIRDLRIGSGSSRFDRNFLIPNIEKMPRERVISAITAKLPSCFTSSSDAVPVDVELQLHSTRTENRWSMLVYLFSGGILPMWLDCISENEITVKIHGEKKTVRSASMPLKLMYSWSMSVYTPIGGIPYKPIPGAISNTTKAPSFPGPSDEEMLEAVADSAAKVIIRAIAKCGEVDGHKRRAEAVVPASSSPGVPIREKPPAAKESADDVLLFDNGIQSGNCTTCGAIKGEDGKCPLCQAFSK